MIRRHNARIRARAAELARREGIAVNRDDEALWAGDVPRLEELRELVNLHGLEWLPSDDEAP